MHDPQEANLVYAREQYAIGNWQRVVDRAGTILKWATKEEQRWEAHRLRGLSYQRLDQSEDALRELNYYLQYVPDDVEVRYTKAYILIDLARFVEACKLAERLHEGYPDSAEIFDLFRDTLEYLGDYARLHKLLQAELEHTPNDPYLREQYALACVQLKEFAEAIRTLEDLPYRKERFENSANALAYAYIRLNRFDEAIMVLDQLLLDGPKNGMALSNRARAYANLGQAQDALAEMNAVIKHFPEDPYHYKNRAVVYLLLREQAKAKADLYKARQLDYALLYDQEVAELLRAHFGEL